MELVNYVNDVAQPASQVLITYDANGKYQAAYSYGLERIKVDVLGDSRPDSQDPLYYLYDGLGSVSQLMMPGGNIRASFNYDPFGDPVTGGHLPIDNYNVLDNPFGYTGQQHDQETGFIYLRARYYDPSIGRFINRDSFLGELSDPQSQNRYVYVENNPLIYVDPSGRCKGTLTIWEVPLPEWKIAGFNDIGPVYYSYGAQLKVSYTVPGVGVIVPEISPFDVKIGPVTFNKFGYPSGITFDSVTTNTSVIASSSGIPPYSSSEWSHEKTYTSQEYGKFTVSLSLDQVAHQGKWGKAIKVAAEGGAALITILKYIKQVLPALG